MQHFANTCISPRPSGALWGKVLIQVVKELEQQARQNICTLIFSAAVNQVISECNLIMENSRDSIKATVKQAMSEINKGTTLKGQPKMPMTKPVTIWISWIGGSIFNSGP